MSKDMIDELRHNLLCLVEWVDDHTVKPNEISEVIAARATLAKPIGWQPMETAPKDGVHCILAIPSGPFVYAIQGAFMMGKWHNAADIKSEPLCWMPNVLIPDQFLPWLKSA